mgnify:CR=1 FL=1
MRGREKIEAEVPDDLHHVADRTKMGALTLEVLLDIRDLLTKLADKLDDVVDDRDRFHVSTHPG